MAFNWYLYTIQVKVTHNDSPPTFERVETFESLGSKEQSLTSETSKVQTLDSPGSKTVALESQGRKIITLYSPGRKDDVIN